MEMAASEARLVILNGTKNGFSHIAVNPPKIVLANDENPEEVKAFQDTAYAFLRENGVETIAIKKRNKRGEFSGGPVSFKLEGVIQLYAGCPVSLFSPQTIAAAQRNYTPVIPTGIRKYQQFAFETAFAALP
ncbi:MAG: DUF3010 family protein [Nitrospirae bacterium]|nr:DUF3010 family protein [Nitrospirota bacterium]